MGGWADVTPLSSFRRVVLTVLLVVVTVVATRWLLGPLWAHGADWTTWGNSQTHFVVMALARAALAWGVSLAVATVALHRSSRAAQLYVRAALWAVMFEATAELLGDWMFMHGVNQGLLPGAWYMPTEELVLQGLLLFLPGVALLLLGRHGLRGAPDGRRSSTRFDGSLALAAVLVGAVGILALVRTLGTFSPAGPSMWQIVFGLALLATAWGLARMRVWALMSHVALTTVALGLAGVRIAEVVQRFEMRWAGSIDVRTVLIPAVLVVQALVVVPVILAITRGYPVPENPRRERIGFLATQVVVVLLMAVAGVAFATA